MELTITKRDFVRGLARTHGVADRKSSMPILANVLLSTEGTGTLRLAATDLYLGVTALSAAKVTKGGSVAVSARTVFDIAKNLPEGDVVFQLAEGVVEIRCGRVKYKIPALPGDDFPALPNPGDGEKATLDADVLGELVAMTQYSMSTDDTRPHLAGTLFEGDGKVVRMVTTDGHRLSKAEHRLEESPMLNFSMLIPHKGISELKRVLEDAKTDRAKGEETPSAISIRASGGYAFFERDGLVLSVKLAEEQFPPYGKVIPQQQTRRVVAARGKLVEALRRISLVASDKSSGVQLHLTEGMLRVQSRNPDVGEGTEELEVDYAGEALSIGFNARYVLDVLGSLPHDEVALELSGELDPGVIRPVRTEGTDFVGVIMPMRI